MLHPSGVMQQLIARGGRVTLAKAIRNTLQGLLAVVAQIAPLWVLLVRPLRIEVNALE